MLTYSLVNLPLFKNSSLAPTSVRWSLKFLFGSKVGDLCWEIFVALSIMSWDSDLWFVLSSTAQPRFCNPANMSDRKFPGSIEGSCLTSPSNTILRRQASLINILNKLWNVVMATKEHSSTTRVLIYLNFHSASGFFFRILQYIMKLNVTWCRVKPSFPARLPSMLAALPVGAV